MRQVSTLALAALAGLLAGCASSGGRRAAPALSYDEATAFERSLQAAPAAPLSAPARRYTQAVNHDEPCVLPTSEEQLQRPHFRAYWDGECRDGFAYGLGRDIAISDTHHIEEITVHNGDDADHGGPAVLYDFVNNFVQYRVPGATFPAASWYNESISNGPYAFNVVWTLGVTTENGQSLVTQGSPFSPSRVLVNDERNVAYKFTDNTAMPAVDNAAIAFSAETLDPLSKKNGGVAVVRYAGGQVQHVKLGGTQAQAVTLPADYLSHLNEKLTAVLSAQATASASIGRAQQIEREYLYMACNGQHAIRGLDAATATQICSWRAKFQQPYEKALMKYTQQLERARQMAASAEQQRQIQAQIALQTEMLRQQQSQLAFQQSMDALAQTSRDLQFASQQMQLNTMRQPVPQISPLTPSGNDRMTCINTGPVTQCRY